MLHTAPEKHTPKSLILKAGCWGGGGARKREGTETLTKKQIQRQFTHFTALCYCGRKTGLQRTVSNGTFWFVIH